ncbi:MAG: hypothetical protein ACAI44_00800 [Candidatus Sericytochromatia bacterium]
MNKTLFVVAAGMALLIGLIALLLIDQADRAKRDPSKLARKELSMRQRELLQMLDQYSFMTETVYGRRDDYPPKIKDCLNLFLITDWRNNAPMALARQAFPTRKNVYTGQTGIDTQYADAVDYAKAADKSAFKGMLVYRAQDCKPVVKAPKGKAPAQSCAGFTLYATGPKGQLLTPWSEHTSD